MIVDGSDGVLLRRKTIDNSGVIREVDHRSSRDLWWLLLLAAALVASLGLYAWPHLELRRTGIAADRMARERDRLIEENRKLRLEKASLENLVRVEAIAVRDLGLVPPDPSRVIVVEKPPSVPDGTRLASGSEPRSPGAN
jgi:cell division protein FtsL